jgi:hypothetical protein
MEIVHNKVQQSSLTYLATFPSLFTRTRTQPELIIVFVYRSIIEIHRFSGLGKNELRLSIKHTNHRTLYIQSQSRQLTE